MAFMSPTRRALPAKGVTVLLVEHNLSWPV
jgi:hypothetical protein